MFKIKSKYVILCIIFLNMLIVQVHAEEFIKISGGLGLMENGTVWKLPIETDRMLMLYSLEYKETKQEKKTLTQIPIIDGIIDFEADTEYDGEEYVLKDILYLSEDHTAYGYSNIILDGVVQNGGVDIVIPNVQKLSPDQLKIAIGQNGFYIWPILSEEGLNPVRMEAPENIKVVSSIGMSGYLVDDFGCLYRWSYPTGVEQLNGIENIQNISVLEYHPPLLLTESGEAFLCPDSSLIDGDITDKKKLMENVSDIQRVEIANSNSSDDTVELASHYVALKEDGTVWHFGYMADKYRQESEEELKLGKNVMKESVQIKGIDGVKQIDVLDENIFMLKEDGSIVLWGLEPQGGMHTDTPYPLVVRDFYLYMTTAKDTIEINGLESELDEGRGTRPEVNNGTVMVPVRNIVEKLGGSVRWEEELQRVTIDLWGRTIQIRVGDNQSVENDTNQTLSGPSIKLNDRTMVAIDFFEKVLGFTVETEEREGETTIKLVYNEIVQ